MKIITIEIPNSKTEKLFNEFASKNDIVINPKINTKVTRKLTIAEEDHILGLMMQDVDLTKTVSRDTIMKKLRK